MTTVEIANDQIRRRFRHTTFAHLTKVPVLKVDNTGRRHLIVFDGDLDDATVDAVREFVTSRDDAELKGRKALRDALKDIADAEAAVEAVRKKPNGQIVPADTKDMARQLAVVLRTQRRLVRAALGRFDDTD